MDNYWEDFVEALFEPILILDLTGKILYANKASSNLFKKKKVEMIGSNFSFPMELEKPTEIEILDSNKKILYADVYMRQGAWKNTSAYIVTVHDITSRKEKENELNILVNVFTYAKEGMMITDSALNIVDVNAEFSSITQYAKEEVVGKKPSILKSGVQSAHFYQQMWADLKRDGYWYGEMWNKKKDNTIYPELLAISSVKNSDDVVENYIGVFYDITEQESQKNQLERMAYYDNLTNLPNRRLLIERLEAAMKKTKRSNTYIVLAFLDIDNFKLINDLYDHKTGDELLIEVSKLLKQSIRETDTLARLGGDEFVIVMEDFKDPYDYRDVIDNIFKVFNRQLIVNQHEFLITLSVGISFYPQKSTLSPVIFLSQADQAMYKSKIAGKNKYTLFDLSLDLEMREQENLIQEMKLALKNNELILYYQPKVSLKTRKLLGLEGLIRWNHPTKGLLEPAQFLPSIKQVKFLSELSELTLRLALEQLQRLNDIDSSLTISININATQLEADDFLEKLKSSIKSYPENIYRRLELEILESSVISKFKITADIIRKCNELGITFSLDDFGTEYSSINYLANLPFKYMKIDTAFISNIINNERDTKILMAIFDIAKAIQVQVIAEGVETPELMNYLINIGCEYAQGYAISRPMPAEHFSAWYESWMGASR